MEEEKFDEVEQMCRKILTNSPENSEIQLIFVRALLKNYKFDKIIMFINNNIGEENRKIKYFDFYLAKAYYYENKFDESKKLLNDLINEMKNNKKEDADDHNIYENLNGISEGLLNLIEKLETLKIKADKLYDEGNYKEAKNEYNKI